MAIRLQVYQSTLEITCGEPVIEGGIRANEVVFTFSPDDTTWDGMARMAVFETRVDKRAVLLEDGRSCTIPWEVLADGSAGSYLRIGLYGTEEDSDGVIVRSTIWADNPYRVLPGPDADPGKDPTPDQYQQMLGLTSKVASRLDELDQVETDVKASEQRAAASETAAANSAAAARNSASAAQTSATAAASAKTGAEQAEGEAEQAENAAAISAHNAQVWAEGGTLQDADGGDDPDGPRDGAKQLAEKAEEAKELAVQAAASAAGAQANAAQAAQEASTRANQAQQSASAADSSRAAAETAAGDAKASETSAAASEEAAKTSETNAKASETAAEESAAEAEAAQEAAERARAAVENMQVQAQTLEPGADAAVTKTVENGVVKLLYGIPEGKQGPQGPPGSAVTATGLWGVDIKNGDLILTYTGDDIPPLSIKDGDLIYTLDGNEINLGHVVGRDSQTPSITVGQVETLPAGSHVTASITGETPNLVLNLGIPEGKQGEPGQAATIEIVETETVSSDAPAAMVELPDSTPQARRYKAQVPQGIQGPAGAGVPPTDGVPEDYLLSVGGWAPPPDGGTGLGDLELVASATLEEAVDVISLDLSKPCTEVIAVLTPYGDAGNPSGAVLAYLFLTSNPADEGINDVEGISFSKLNLKNDGAMVWDFRAAHWRLEGNLIYKASYKEGGYQPDGVMVNGAGPWQVQGNNWEITDIDAFRNLRAQLWNAVFGAGTKLEVYGR